MQQSILKFYCFVVQRLLNTFRGLQCPSSEACQTAVAASDFRMNVEVEVFSAVVGLLTNRPWLRTLPPPHVHTLLNMFRALQCPSSGARQTAIAASGFRMNVNKPTTPENTSTSTFIRKPESATAVWQAPDDGHCNARNMLRSVCTTKQ
jgi:hypothetical protein